MPGSLGGNATGNSGGGEYWSHLPTRAVNWMRLRYRAKLAGLALVTIALTGVLIYTWLYWGNDTRLVLVKPGKPGASWLATPPYMKSLTRDSMDSNADLRTIGEFDLLDPASEDWEKLPQEHSIEFGGPDGEVLLFYINAIGVAYATDENEENDTNLIACTLPADVSPFDSDQGLRRYSLKDLLDRIVATDSGKSGTKIVLIDAHPLETPSNPGLLVDRFPQAVHDLYEQYYKNDEGKANRLVLICSHSPGQRNWPAPELDSSVFGFFARAALLGAADGATGNGQDKRITFDEFCDYLAFRVAEHSGKFRLATQNPMILTPESFDREGSSKVRSRELALTYCQPASTVADAMKASGLAASERISRLGEKYQLPKMWQDYDALESSRRLDRDPMLAGQAAAVLSRMEQLICELGIDADELVALETKWNDLIKSIDQPGSFSPVSLAEAEWLDQRELQSANSGNRKLTRLPGSSERTSLQQTLSGWVKLQESPVVQPGVAPAADSAGASKENAEVADGKSPAEGEGTVAVAQEPDAGADEVKKRIAQIESDPWQISAMLWDGMCRNDDFSPDSANLDYWLTKLDESSARAPGRLPVSEFVEMKFLRLLLQNIDWKSESPEIVEKAVRRAVQCRQACEAFATNLDPRVQIWVSAEIGQLEDTRRIAEDYLFASQFDIAGKLFDRVLEQLPGTKAVHLGNRARALASAFDLRNEVARKSPHLAMLIARQIRRNESTGSEIPSGVDVSEMRDRWLSLVQQNHQLAYELWRPSTGIEEAVTSDTLVQNTERILELARDVNSTLGFLEGQIGKQREYLADIKSDDIQAMVYIPDLLVSPLVTTRREVLRARYLKALSAVNPDIGAGQRVLSARFPYATAPQQEILAFLRSGDVVNQQDYFTPVQRTILAKPFRKYWDTTRISVESIDEIGRQLQQFLDPTDSLASQRSVLQNSDYWLRCVASGLADYQGEFADTTDQSGHYFHELGQIGGKLYRVQDSLHKSFMIERILDDFWGNNRMADSTAPYFQRVAAIIYDRIADDHRKLLDTRLQPVFASRLNSAQAFQITCDDYRYLRNEAEDQPHAFSVRANADLDQRTELEGKEQGPIAVAQLQLRGRWMSPDPLPVNAIGEKGTSAERRIAYDLEKLRLGDVPKQLFSFPADQLSTLGDVQAVLSFRGHLTDARFIVRAMDRQPAEYIPSIALNHTPTPWRAPTVIVNSDERAVTDVIFVLDCSYSMSGSFRAGELEGSDNSPSSTGSSTDIDPGTTRFEFLKSAIVDRLNQMRTSKLNRVGIVAVGSRVNFRKVGKSSFNELRFSDPDQAKKWEAERVRPNNDAHVIANLTSTAVWTAREWEEIEDAVKKLQPFGQTPLYAGMLRATEMLNSSKDDRSKVIVVISDGVEEVYEFNGQYPELDESFTSKNYDLLKKGLPASKIKVFFVGFDLANDNSQSAQDQKRRLNQLQDGLFETRLKEIKALKTKDYYPSQLQEFREDLDEIARASRFVVSQSGKSIAKEKLNQAWQPASIEAFQPGAYEVSIQDSPASTTLWLEDGEFITLGYNGSDLSLANSRNAGANAIASVNHSLGRDQYSISLFQPNLQRPDTIPFEFLMERIPNNMFSFRPDRLCLEILHDSPSKTEPAYILQDYRFINKPDQNAPVIQFASPGLKPGVYKLRLWTRPFQPNRESPPGQIVLSESNLNDRSGALKQEQIFGDDKVEIEAWGDSLKRSITIRLTATRPRLLRTLLVDLYVEDSPGKARYGIDFPTNRVFAEPVLLGGSDDSGEQADSAPAYVEHTFILDKQYHALPISFSVRPLDKIFGESDFADFKFQKN